MKTSNNLIIVGAVLAVTGFGLMLYGNSQNNNIGAQLTSLFGSGRTNPGTPWMIFGGVIIGIGVILVVKKLFVDKE
jgi:hypothetical protein